MRERNTGYRHSTTHHPLFTVLHALFAPALRHWPYMANIRIGHSAGPIDGPPRRPMRAPEHSRRRTGYTNHDQRAVTLVSTIVHSGDFVPRLMPRMASPIGHDENTGTAPASKLAVRTNAYVRYLASFCDIRERTLTPDAEIRGSRGCYDLPRRK